jgi:hypothetical protein
VDLASNQKGKRCARHLFRRRRWPKGRPHPAPTEAVPGAVVPRRRATGPNERVERAVVHVGLEIIGKLATVLRVGPRRVLPEAAQSGKAEECRIGRFRDPGSPVTLPAVLAHLCHALRIGRTAGSAWRYIISGSAGLPDSSGTPAENQRSGFGMGLASFSSERPLIARTGVQTNHQSSSGGCRSADETASNR